MTLKSSALTIPSLLKSPFIQTLSAAPKCCDKVVKSVFDSPEELRVPLILSVYEEQAHAEIAEVLDCSAKAVEMRLYRARQHLRERLEKSLAVH